MSKYRGEWGIGSQMAENPRQGAEELQKMLKSATVMWKQLARAATFAKVPIPAEAQMTPPPAAAANGNGPDGGAQNPGALVWDEFAAANAADWDGFKDEGEKHACGSEVVLRPAGTRLKHWMLIALPQASHD